MKKGERGIRILAPVIGVRRKKDAEAEKGIRTQNQAVLVGFRSAYVFDVSQTEGKELPELSERVTGNVGEYREWLLDFIAAQGIRVEFKESIAPALGMSYGGRIAVLPDQGAAEEFSTLVHELAHEMLHKAERRTATTKTVRETEAEAISFVVGKTIGLTTGRASAEFRHGDHRFEWSRTEFEGWASGVAQRFGYDVRFEPVGPVDAERGAPTQMAVFTQKEVAA